ncbi:sulfotransferase family 2 domain-containing protein [Amphritea sp. HPY]|uniref:sulfotransferase family 2 domain-containing protein n=1 Tax=Amphritea sp. HPY TaxID=3421652 RepID=UPI003D7EA882
MKGYLLSGGKLGYRYFPKVACTSIKTALYEIDEQKRFSRDESGMHIHQYVKMNKLAEMDGCERRFVVIRDPVKRLLSAYSNRVTYHKELSEKYIREKASKYYDTIPYFDPTLDQFVDNLGVYLNIGVIKHHVRPVSYFMEGEGLNYFTDVYRMEDISQFESDLSEVFEREVTFEHKQTGGKKLSLKDLSAGQVRKLLKYYKKDYTLLRNYYSEDAVWEEWKKENNCSNSSLKFQLICDWVGFSRSKVIKQRQSA